MGFELSRMSTLISTLIDAPFEFVAPFAFRLDIFSGRRVAGVKTLQDLLEKPVYAINDGVYHLRKASANANPFRALMRLSGMNYCDREEEFLSATAHVSGTPRQTVPERLLNLYSRYAEEWKAIRPAVGILPSLGDSSCNRETQEVGVA
jgi:hypothetical protein